MEKIKHFINRIKWNHALFVLVLVVLFFSWVDIAFDVLPGDKDWKYNPIILAVNFFSQFVS